MSISDFSNDDDFDQYKEGLFSENEDPWTYFENRMIHQRKKHSESKRHPHYDERPNHHKKDYHFMSGQLPQVFNYPNASIP